MKPYIIMVYRGQGSDGPFLAVAESKARAVKYAIRELVKRGKIPFHGDNTCKAVASLLKVSWVKTEEEGLKPLEQYPYGNGYFVVYNKKKDKITLTEV